MKSDKGKPATRRSIRDRRGAITAKLDNFALAEDEDGFRYWLIDEAELDEKSPEFEAALDAWKERVAQIRVHRRRRQR